MRQPQLASGPTKRNKSIDLATTSRPRRALDNNNNTESFLDSRSDRDLKLLMLEPPWAPSVHRAPPLSEEPLSQRLSLLVGQPLDPKATLALAPLVVIHLSEPILSMAFDPVGRRLISSEPSRGIRFRSVTYAGDDLSPPDCGCLDWRVWARAACMLPCGHLLVATPSNVQLLRPDGSRLAVAEHQPGIVGLAVYERSALAIGSWKGSLSVFELPSLRCRSYHPLNSVKPQESSQPTALCALRNLAAIASQNDTLITFEIDTGRLHQSVNLSSRSGPKELASCSILGVLFVSLFADRCIYIFTLQAGMLEKTGALRDPGLKPGPVAWLPINGILFCAGCNAKYSRKYELRSFALHEADMVNWTPRAIRLMGL